MRQRFMEIHVEWFKSQNPEEIESKLRELVEKKVIPPVRKLIVNVDHKNFMYGSNKKGKLPRSKEVKVNEKKVKSWYELFEEIGT